MICLDTLQEQCNKIAKRFKYKTDKRSTYKHLKKELKEWYKSAPVEPNLIETAINIQDDTTFMIYWNQFLKDTEVDEIPDMPFILMSFSHDRCYSIEDLLMLKKRYNELR